MTYYLNTTSGDDVPVIAGSALKALEGDAQYEEKS